MENRKMEKWKIEKWKIEKWKNGKIEKWKNKYNQSVDHIRQSAKKKRTPDFSSARNVQCLCRAFHQICAETIRVKMQFLCTYFKKRIR